MIIVITGQPGNGKTLRAMDHMRLEYERNAAAVKEGKEQPRRFFSNVKGATTEENPEAFPWVERMPEHNDWTKLPDGCYVQYDEAHSDGQTPGLERYGLLFPSTGKPGESTDPRIRAMSTHRHRGVDLVLVTQWPSKIHHQVRTLVGQHIHMNRAMGMQRAGVLTWSRMQANPYDEKEREKAEEEIWTYPKDLYTRYISATLHTSTYKFKIPMKVWSGLSVAVTVVMIVAGIYWWMSPAKAEAPADGGADKALARSAGDPPPAPPVEFETIDLGQSAPHLAPIAGCVSGRHGCRCFTTEGFEIDQTQQQCQDMLAGPLRVNVYHAYTTGTPAYTADAAASPPRDDGDRSLGPGLTALDNAEIASYGDYGVRTGRYIGQGVSR